MSVVMVLAAGYGTRLRPLTNERPKALVPLGDRPVIAHQIERIRDQLGAVTILMNTHHLANELAAYVAKFDAAVRIVEEREILGTAGGLHAALEVLHDGPLLVLNSDVISDAKYGELLNIVGSDDIVLRVVPRPTGLGPVGVDAQGNVVRLRNERFGIEVSGGDYLGVAAIGSGAARQLPTCGCLVSDFMLPWLRSGFRIQTLLGPCQWIDLGSPVEYFRANMAWLRRCSSGSWVSPSAIVSGSVLIKDSVVGEAAQVVGEGSLRRVIAWPDAVVHAPLEDAIVTSRGLVLRLAENELRN